MYLGEWRGLIALLIFGVGFWLKAAREETLLESEFGEDYRDTDIGRECSCRASAGDAFSRGRRPSDFLPCVALPGQ